MKPLRILTILILFFISGCGDTRKKEDIFPSPSSSISKESAISFANLWVVLGQGNRLYTIPSDTGSMAPYMDSRCVVLLEKVTPETIINVGDIVVFDRGDISNVMHFVKDKKNTEYFISGASQMSDGWFKHKDIAYRAAGVLYTKR